MGTQLSLLSDNAEPAERRVLSVTELTRQIKRVLEGGFSSVTLQGEISNFKQHASGHMYFALKDSSAAIAAVVWRSRVPFLSFSPDDGLKVVATGRVTVYEPRGSYQIDITSMRPLGAGDLQAAFERLKKKLYEEGLFDEARKKPLPPYPDRIGIITSEDGAALHDILHVFRRRFPAVEVILLPVPVQGPAAVHQIAEAIRDLNAWGNIDVIIVARGGGSLEDLWAFNEEGVARAIFHSSIPVVSAVGHEIDFTIADFVADLRAPTPSAAAELVVRDRAAVLDTLRNNWYHMHQNVRTIIKHQNGRIRTLLSSYSFNKPIDLLRGHSQRVDELERSLASVVSHTFSTLKARAGSLQRQLAALDPRMVLRRGFAIVRKGSRVVSSSTQLQQRDDIEVTFHDGTTTAKVT